MNRTLILKHPVWLDDIIVTKGNMKKHEAELRKTMKMLKIDGDRLYPKIAISSKQLKGSGTKMTLSYTITTIQTVCNNKMNK